MITTRTVPAPLPTTACRRSSRAVDYLLRGHDEPIEDRLQTLIDPRNPIGMTGFRESLLTRTLCVIYPARFLPILTYTSPAGGKKEIAAAVFGLALSSPETTSMTSGRLVFCSNDLLLRLCGTGFTDVAHASEFLGGPRTSLDRPAPHSTSNVAVWPQDPMLVIPEGAGPRLTGVQPYGRALTTSSP